ncbi:MAG: hypothetical protein ACI4ET_05050 [Bilifractor sp.]
MMNANTTSENSNGRKNPENMHNSGAKKATWQERVDAYLDEVIAYYGGISAKGGYRNPFAF